MRANYVEKGNVRFKNSNYSGLKTCRFLSTKYKRGRAWETNGHADGWQNNIWLSRSSRNSYHTENLHMHIQWAILPRNTQNIHANAKEDYPINNDMSAAYPMRITPCRNARGTNKYSVRQSMTDKPPLGLAHRAIWILIKMCPKCQTTFA